MQHNQKTLYYIHDPMCSWCWGFKPTLEKLERELADNISVQYVLGGLAEDSQRPMPEKMQQFLQQTWHNIKDTIPNTEFNFDFWKKCSPRRSTYPACRAVIAAKKQNQSIEKEFIINIQQAYYLQAKNPSDNQTLIEIAKHLGLDVDQFSNDLNSEETHSALISDINFSRQLDVTSFPSLVYEDQKGRRLIELDYNNVESMLQQIEGFN